MFHPSAKMLYVHIGAYVLCTAMKILICEPTIVCNNYMCTVYGAVVFDNATMPMHNYVFGTSMILF